MTTDPLTPEELDRIERLYADATLGPWKIYTPSDEYNEIRGYADRHVAGQCTQRIFGDIDVRPNANLIAAQRQFGPRLIEEVRALRNHVKHLIDEKNAALKALDEWRKELCTDD